MNTANTDKGIIIGMLAMNEQIQNSKLRNAIAEVLRGGEPQQPDEIKQRVVSGDEAARILGLTRRSVLNLVKAGSIKRAVLPGRLRGFGYTRDSVEALAVAEGGAK